MRRRDCRPLEEVLSAWHWQSFVDALDIPRMLEDGELGILDLRMLDRFFYWVKDNAPGEALTAELFLRFADYVGRPSPSALHALGRALRKLAVRSPTHVALEQAVLRRRRAWKPRKEAWKPRVRRFSVPEADLPEEWRLALAAMRQGRTGCDDRVPPHSMIMTTATKLCELAAAAFEAGLPARLEPQALTVYERSLLGRGRKLSPRTLLSSMRQLQGFARYLGAASDSLAHLADRVRFHEGRCRGAVTVKEEAILAVPDYETIFGVAVALRDAAHAAVNPRHAVHMRAAACALTLFCPVPLRLEDSRLHFGMQLTWTGELWHLRLRISKTSRLFETDLLPAFGEFIDEILLAGCGREHLAVMREAALREGRPLFADHDGKPLHRRHVSTLWRRAFGTGAHIARTKLHDSFAVLGPRGVALARAACDHASPKTAALYRTAAFRIAAIAHVHAVLDADISEAERKHWFT